MLTINDTSLSCIAVLGAGLLVFIIDSRKRASFMYYASGFSLDVCQICKSILGYSAAVPELLTTP